MHHDTLDGIIIGGVGGAIAGLAIWLIQFVREKLSEYRDKNRIYGWLYEETKDKDYKWRSTRAIASYNDLTEDRVRYICSIHPQIKLSTGDNEDLWGIEQFTRGNRYSAPINPGF